jgi:hypothetical protein
MGGRSWFLCGMLLTGASLVGCAGQSLAYGDSSVGERWTILKADDPEVPERRAALPREHGYGWATQVGTYTSDEGPSDLIVGPFAYAGEDPVNINVSYAIFADPPLSGRLVFEAVASPPHRLPVSWASGIERAVVMHEKHRIDSVMVPQLGVPTESLTIRWVTDGAGTASDPQGDQQ